ncbi:relaxase/mobilization nuclease domain-containing protein [uncultured Roseobacter sp.]|uniref:relaxase/mobilization nuclease domain-containing protein n=1 Tax=uncultured Roseobacter sp. TaxID=114847 RepID=UPI00345CC6BE
MSATAKRRGRPWARTKRASPRGNAISKGTRCQQHLFSLSINPPETERVSTGESLDAVERIDKKLRLDDQARAVVFHEKNGRRHAHVVWSRIDVMEMKAMNLPCYHTRLKEISKDLFLEHGWRLPDGYHDKRNIDPRNFSLSLSGSRPNGQRRMRERDQTHFSGIIVCLRYQRSLCRCP